MIDLHVYDPSNHLFLTGYALPPTDVIDQLSRALLLGARPADRAVQSEIQMAELVTKLAALNISPSTGRHGQIRRRAVALETWIIGRPSRKASKLRSWFSAEPSAYRVFIHRTRRSSEEHGPSLFWDAAYERIHTSNPGALARPVPTTDALREGASFLGELLGAYQSGGDRVERLVEQSSHKFLHHVGSSSSGGLGRAD